jgi:hypothetical protein
MAMPVVASRSEQALDLALGQVLARAKGRVWPPQWRDCPIF